MDIPPSEITPEHLYLSRRRFIAGLGAVAGAALLGACAPSPGAPRPRPPGRRPRPAPPRTSWATSSPTSTSVTTYNNYYEFSLDKSGIDRLAQNLKLSPWQVAVGGLVNNPRTYDIDELRRLYPVPGAHLPAALRGGLVHGHPLAGLSRWATC